MAKYRINYLYLMSIILMGCLSQSTHKKIVEEREALILSKEVLSFFPNEILLKKGLRQVFQSTNAFYDEVPYDTIFFATTELVEMYQVDDNNLADSLKNIYREIAITQFLSEDKDYFVISSERDLFRQYDSLTLVKKYEETPPDKITVDFHSYFEDGHPLYKKENTNGLEDGYHIVVLKMDSAYILPAKYKNEWKLHPSFLKHGYRNGVAFKDKGGYLIYWVVAW